VIESATIHERELQDRKGRWHQLRIRPYKTQDHKLDGAVVTLVDIDQFKVAKKSRKGAVHEN
jgi:two-component system CheB/CheR fusion protein